MKNYQIEELETIFNKLVEYANKKKKCKNINLENKDSYIEFIYKKISQYFLYIDPYKVLIHLDSYIHIIYNSEKYGQKIYRIYCPWYGKNEFYIPDNIYNVECPIVNFNDVIYFYKGEIKNILYKEKEVNKQKIKRI